MGNFIFFNSRLVIITFATSHFLINSDIKFALKYKITSSTATTRKKSGSSQVKIGSKLCTLTYTDEQNNSKTLDVISMVKGTLFETNAKIEEDPSLVKLKPETDGYLAIIDPRRNENPIKEYLETLISEKIFKEKRQKK